MNVSIYNYNPKADAVKDPIAIELNYWLTLYFSYSTLIAFTVRLRVAPDSSIRLAVCVLKNYWSNTTGKHMGWLRTIQGDVVNDRMKQEDFDRALQLVYRYTFAEQPTQDQANELLGMLGDKEAASKT